MLSDLRRERLGTVVLVCLCLVIQNGFPALAVSLGDRQILSGMLLCDGSLPAGESGNSSGAEHPCLAGACAMAGCSPGIVTNPRHTEFLPISGPPASESGIRVAAIGRNGKAPIRGPPKSP